MRSRDNQIRGALAVGFTAAIVTFVGAIVVLSIPYAVFSAPLPASVNRIGLSVEATRPLFFGRPWILLAPSILVALWIGYRAYHWARTAGVDQVMRGR